MPNVPKHIPQKLRKLRLTKKYHHDKTAKNLPDLKKGDVVRIYTKDGYKKLSVVKKAAQEPCSYIIVAGNKEYRQNRRDLLKTKETSMDLESDEYLEDYVNLTRSEETGPHHSAKPETSALDKQLQTCPNRNFLNHH